MKKLMLFAMLCAVFCLALTGCGGGGGGGDSSPSTPTGSGIASVGFHAGDSLTYDYVATPTGTTTGSSIANLETRYIADVRVDGSSRINRTYSDGNLLVDQEVDKDYQELSYLSGNTVCSNSPKIDSPAAPWFVGKTWDINYTRTCVTNSTSTTTNWNNKGSTISEEPYTTTAGTFQTYKQKYTVTGQSPTGTYIYDYTAWRDKSLNRTVAWEYAYSFIPTGSTIPTSTYTNTKKLFSYSVADLGNNSSTEKFAGTWNIAWTGPSAGYCNGVTVATSGKITGTCYPSEGADLGYTLTGNVSPSGTVQATISSGDSLSGKFNSPVSGAGTWSNSQRSGTWSAIHK